MLTRAGALFLRNGIKYTGKRYGHDGGVPGENLPFGKSLGRPVKLTALFILYFGSGLMAPQLIFMYMYLK